MVDLRKRMLDENAELPECSECIAIEKNGGTNSDRMQHEKFYENENIIQFDIELVINIIDQLILICVWKLMCNLQCRMWGRK